MNSAVDDVLEFLAEYDIGLPIGVLDNNLERSHSTIGRALGELEDRGYVARDENYNSHYRITARGREYLRGERDAAEDA
ncbi:helix-turn-helix domain-containing protein [Halomontanus rarus]|uniref:helix-turn-helix domain-containing protein n=1 Tax=Halomontanus rarus TaxID=3034020 RepID=UPI00307C5139